MDRARISHLAHAAHPIAAPLADSAVDSLLRVALVEVRTVVDLGCGNGTWLLRALRIDPELTAVGVDLSGLGFDAVRAQAQREGVGERLQLVQADASTWRGQQPADVVLCVGSTHAFGGLQATVTAMESHLRPGGVLLVGEGIWDRPPSDAVLELLGAAPGQYAALAGTIAQLGDRGWVPLHGHVSTLEEWDDYEWSWTGSLVRWARDHPEDPDRDQVLATAAAHRTEWLEGYRGTLGFLTVVLGRPDDGLQAGGGLLP